MLKLPSDELKALCVYHLLLKELVPCELSLYILELDFLERKETAFIFYELNIDYEPSMFTQAQNTRKYNSFARLRATAVKLLGSLEDRYVNPVVAYRLYNSTNTASNWIRDIPRILLQSKPEEDLSSEEAYCLAELSKYTEKSLRVYELAASKGSTKAMRHIAKYYARQTNMKEAIFHYEQAIALGCPYAMYELATMPGVFNQTNPQYVALLKQASLLGVQAAIETCRREGITSLLS